MNCRVAFLEALHDQVLMGDGAMGSELLQRVDTGVCVEMLNLTHPDLVADLHREYVAAGCQVIETNTFAANPLTLQRYNAEHRWNDILQSGVSLARSAGGDVYVAGAIGPLGDQDGEPLSTDRQHRIYTDLVTAFLEQKVDLLIFESFTDLEEIAVAIEAARSVCRQMPIVAQMAFDRYGHVDGRADAASVAARCLQAGADVVGANCGYGAVSVLRAVRVMRDFGAPVSAFINAGMPEQVNGRAVYQATPAYIASRARELAETGVRLIGGCCGVGPEALKEIRRAVTESMALPRPAVWGVDRLSVTRSCLTENTAAQKCQQPMGRVLVELEAPSHADLSAIVSAARMARDAGATAVTVPDNPMSCVHMDSITVAALLQREVNVPAIAHMACRDRNRLALQAGILAAQALQLAALLCVTGDAVRAHGDAKTTGVFDVNSIGLLHLARQVLSQCNTRPDAPALRLGAGVNPNVRDLSGQLSKLRRKIDAGAEYVLTQPLYDWERFCMLHDALQRFQIDIPVHVGLLPLKSLRHAEYLHHEVPGIVVPDHVMDRLSCLDNPKDQRAAGLDLCMELVDRIAPHLDGVYIIAARNRVQQIRALIGLAARCMSASSPVH